MQSSRRAFDVAAIRRQFPILERLSRGKQLIYLDNAATSQKPDAVIAALDHYYRAGNSNIHRGVYQLSEEATLAWEAARQRAGHFIGAPSSDEIVFVRGTTEAINLVASSFVRPRATATSVVLVTAMEHHANIVPWQLAGASTKAIPISGDGVLDLEAAERMLAERPILLAVAHVSNAIGTVNPVAELCRMAARHGVPVLVDGAQAAPHFAIDVQALGCDFYCFSSHKVFGPTGIGVLWGRSELLDGMPPYQGGGDMIDEVTFERTTFAPVPRRFEAGTPHIAGAVGLDAALGWFEAIDRDAAVRYEETLRDHATNVLGTIPGVRLFGAGAEKAPIATFTLDGVHPHDLASLLDGDGICVRAGHHCTQPLHRALGVPATVRASFAIYNTTAEIDALGDSVIRARTIMGR
ncbi:MAG TPA: SufS family cysteine desulfurase [Gemmatimonadales bacterium]